MNSHRAAPSERHAPSVSVARRVARTRRADPVGIGSGGSRSRELPLDAEAGEPNATAPARMTAELYCERMEFKYMPSVIT